MPAYGNLTFEPVDTEKPIGRYHSRISNSTEYAKPAYCKDKENLTARGSNTVAIQGLEKILERRSPSTKLIFWAKYLLYE